MDFSLRCEPAIQQKFEHTPIWILICPECKNETMLLFGAIHVSANGTKGPFYVCRNGHGTTSPTRRRVERRMPAATQVPDCCTPTCGLPFDLV